MEGKPVSAFPDHTLEARCVQIISDLQRPDQIERAGAIKIVGLRHWPADAGAPSVSIVENKHRHPRRPGTVEGPCLLDNHILEFIGGLEGSRAHGLSRTPLVSRSAIRQVDRIHQTTGSGPGAKMQFGRPIHAGMPRPTPRKNWETSRSARQSGAKKAVRHDRAFVTLNHR
jgi:hypothetical protein